MFDNNWKYTAWHGDGGEIGFTISDDVLKTYMAQINAQEYNVPVEVAEARARLIAAAPALLAAARDVVKTVTPNKLKGTVKTNFSEQVALSQLSKGVNGVNAETTQK